MKGKLSQKLHVSWLVAWLCAGVLTGVALAPYAGESFANLSWLVVGIVCFGGALLKRRMVMVIVVLLAGIFIGLWRGSVERISLDNYQYYYGKSLAVSGKVAEDPSYGKNGNQRLVVASPVIAGQQLPGKVWVSLAVPRDIKRGDLIVVNGLLVEGFGNIPASMFRAEVLNITRPNPGDVGRQVRDWFSAGVYRVLPKDQAGLALGYLVGQKQTLPEDTQEQFRIIGLVHAVVASGFHLTVLVVLVRRLLGGISKYLSAFAGFSMIFGFIAVTGLSPSMSRAGLISGLSLLAWYYGRVIHPLVLLPFAAAVTILFNPAYVWGDIGWYLSFAAFSGVIILAPLLNDYFWGSKKPGYIRTLLITTVAAQLATLPLIIFTFGYYSIYALPANLLIVPLVPFTMLLTFIAGLVGLFAPFLSLLVAAPLGFILEYMLRLVDFMASLPNAKTETTMGMPGMIVFYGLMLLGIVFLWRKTKHNFKVQQDII